jgi:hypothetical protein
MKIKCTIELKEETFEDLWPVYELFDGSEKLIGKLYLRSNHQAPETIKLYREELEDDE